MNCAEFKEQAGAYALGALDPDEAARMDAHLDARATHEGCREALDLALRTAAEIGLALPAVRPGERTWGGIASRILPAANDVPPRRAARGPWSAWALAVAAIIALFLLGREQAMQRDRADRAEQLLADARGELAERDRCRRELQRIKGEDALHRAAVALLDRPATRLVALAPTANGSHGATAVVNMAERRIIVVARGLPALADKDFELWVIRGSAPPSPAGFLRATEAGVALGEIDPKLLEGAAPDAIAVSLEPLGGRPTPTEVVMAGKVPG